MSNRDEIPTRDDWPEPLPSELATADDERSLPIGLWVRGIIGAISLACMLFFGFTCFVIFMVDFGEPGWMVKIILFVTKELLLATSLVGALGVLWAIAMPEWVERMFQAAWRHLFFAIILAAIPIPIMIILVICGMKVFE